ncbi:MAG: (d)CMP kinase [Eubacteriales bacterium]|nr:(d)CMP kinase [Eubacteriales bacterium]
MFSIAIDGPSGSGKSTIAKRIARRFTAAGTQTVYVDTGALYRALAYFLLQNLSENDLDDGEQVARACEEVRVSLHYEDGRQVVTVNGEDVTDRLRTEAVSRLTSRIAVYPAVRDTLLQLQRRMAKHYNVVMDGRDIGTCVLPEANVKIFLEASAEIRAKRRYDELVLRGETADYEQVLNDIIVRDERDRNRKVAPLRQAADAVLLDTSTMDIQAVEEAVMVVCTERLCVK